MAIQFADAVPQREHRGFILLLTGRLIHRAETLQQVQRLPPCAAAWQLVVRHPLCALTQPVAILLKILLHAMHKLQVTCVVRAPIQFGKNVVGTEIKVGIASVNGVPRGIDIDSADTLCRFDHRIVRMPVARIVAPHQKPKHAVVVSPQITIAHKAAVFRERPQIPICILARDEILHKLCGGRFQPGACAYSTCLNRGN